jgi:hypothetical protein
MSPVGNFLVLSHRDSSWRALNMAAHLFLLSTLRMYEAVTCLLAWPLIKSKSKILIDIKGFVHKEDSSLETKFVVLSNFRMPQYSCYL